MRISNVVIGFLLAIVLAYMHDALVSSAVPGEGPRNLVNWTVFGQVASDLGTWTRQQLDHLAAQIRGH